MGYYSLGKTVFSSICNLQISYVSLYLCIDVDVAETFKIIKGMDKVEIDTIFPKNNTGFIKWKFQDVESGNFKIQNLENLRFDISHFLDLKVDI
jgi:hypothetical protein